MSQRHLEKIVGVNSGPTARHRQSAIKRVAIGQMLRLMREPHNHYDANAIAVYAKVTYFWFFPSDVHIGYIDSQLAKAMAPIIDGGATAFCRVAHKLGGSGRAWGLRCEIWCEDAKTPNPTQNLTNKN